MRFMKRVRYGHLSALKRLADKSGVLKDMGRKTLASEADLARQNTQAINEAGVACGADACSHATLRQAPDLLAQAPQGVRGALAGSPDMAAAPPPAVQQAQEAQASQPAAKSKMAPAPPAPKSAAAPVSGFEMETLGKLTPAQKTIGTLALLALAAGLIGLGFWRRRW